MNNHNSLPSSNITTRPSAYMEEDGYPPAQTSLAQSSSGSAAPASMITDDSTAKKFALLFDIILMMCFGLVSVVLLCWKDQFFIPWLQYAAGFSKTKSYRKLKAIYLRIK